jgi:hypothetical protein
MEPNKNEAGFVPGIGVLLGSKELLTATTTLDTNFPSSPPSPSSTTQMQSSQIAVAPAYIVFRVFYDFSFIFNDVAGASLQI